MKERRVKTSFPSFPETCPSDSHLPTPMDQTPCSAARDESLTNTQDVETESLRSRLIDQLVRETVKSNMSRKGQVSKLFILEFQRETLENSWTLPPEKPRIVDIALSLPLFSTGMEKKIPAKTTSSLPSTQLKELKIPKPCVFHEITRTPKADSLPRNLTSGYKSSGPGRYDPLEVAISDTR